MRRLVLLTLTAGLLLGSAVGSMAGRGFTVHVNHQCQEDEVIVGRGDFNGRRWDRYTCQPADDL